MEGSAEPERQEPRREPLDEAEFRKSFRSIRKALRSLHAEIRRRRNRNVLWRF